MKPISLPVAVHIVLHKSKEILLIKRANTGFRDGEWSVPAGRLNSDETIREAAAREALEEVGVSILIKNLSKPLVMHYKDGQGERLYFFFGADKWSKEPWNVELDKCDEIAWFKSDRLPKLLIPHIRDGINKVLEGTSYTEYGFKNTKHIEK